jgi:hypothetical protein
LAEKNAIEGVRDWDAVALREQIVGQSDASQQARRADVEDTAVQHAPALEIPVPAKR